MPDDIEVVDRDELLVVVDGAGEEQFVVFSAVECTSDDIEIHLLRQGGCFVVDRQLVLIDATAHSGLGADMQQLRREPVGNVHHCGRLDARFAQGFEDVAPCFGFELAFKEVLFAGESPLRLPRGGGEISAIVGRTMHHEFALQELQTHIRRAEVAGDADQVVQFGTVAIDDVFGCRHAEASDGDRQSGHGGAGVSADKIDVIPFAGKADAGIERLDVFYRETLGDTERDGDLGRCAVHGVDVREIDHRRLVSKVLEGHVFQVKMNAFEQHVGRHEDALGAEVHDRAVVAHAFFGGRLDVFEILCQMFDESKLTVFRDFSHES